MQFMQSVYLAEALFINGIKVLLEMTDCYFSVFHARTAQIYQELVIQSKTSF